MGFLSHLEIRIAFYSHICKAGRSSFVLRVHVIDFHPTFQCIRTCLATQQPQPPGVL